MECSKCRVASFCPKKGSSPLQLGDNKRALCSLVGGYGRAPVDPSILSDESRAISAANGPCLTLAEVPELDEGSGEVIYSLVKIFSPPILHERETIPWQMDAIIPKVPS